jgi:hypothetical protein
MKMNKWKIAFWACLTILIIVIGLGLYSIIDKGVTSTYLKEGYQDTESDLNNLTKIINETDLTKEQISKTLNKNNLYEYIDFKSDTISLNRITLIFKNDKLYKVSKQW